MILQVSKVHAPNANQQLIVFCSLDYILDVKPNYPTLVQIKGQSSNLVVLGNLSVDISYVTCQIHSHTKTLTLSSTPEPGIGRSSTGVDVGIITVLAANQTEVTWYVISNHTQDVQVLLAVFPMSGNGEFILGIQQRAGVYAAVDIYCLTGHGGIADK